MVEHAWDLDLYRRGRHLDGVEVPDPLAWEAHLQPFEPWPGHRLRRARSQVNGATGSVGDPAWAMADCDLCGPGGRGAVDRVGTSIARPRARLHGWVCCLYCCGACVGSGPLHGRQLARGANVRTCTLADPGHLARAPG